MRHVLRLVLATWLLIAAVAHASQKAEPVWTLMADAPEVYPGEPVALILRASFPSSARWKKSPLQLVFYADDFSVTMQNMNTNEISAGALPELAETSWLSWPYTRPLTNPKNGEPYILSSPFILTGWFSSAFVPGDYKVILKYTSKKAHENAFRVTTLLRILPQNAEEHKRRLANLFTERTRPNNKQEHDNALLKRLLLETARSEYAVPFQLATLQYFAGSDAGWQLLGALHEAGTLEAVQGLMDFVKNRESGTERILDGFSIPYATWSVYQARQKGDPGVLTATEEFIKSHPCPGYRPRRPID